MKNLKPFFDNVKERRKILLDNIFGVDINEESVEITKLSLFLKVCRRGLKLPDLDNNIKCGNSLIDDPEYTKHPFNWEEEFKEILDDGGFDIVVGNPPYVRQERVKELKPYLKDNYSVYTGVSDLYVYFFEKGLELLKRDGLLGFICSNKFTRAKYGKPLRKHLLNYCLMEYVDYTGKNVFMDATIDPCVIIIKKEPCTEFSTVKVDDDFSLKQSLLNEESWSFQPPEVLALKDKISNQGTKIKDITNINVRSGIRTGFNKAFIISEEVKEDLVREDPRNEEIIKPLLRGRDVKKWKIDYKDLYLIFTYLNFPINEYTVLKNYLLNFKLSLEKRAQVIRGDHKWHELDNNPTLDTIKHFENPKIIYPNLATGLYAVVDENKYFINAKCYMIVSNNPKYDIKYLSPLLSSKTLNFIFKLLGTPLARTSTTPHENPRYDLHKNIIKQLPIPPATPEEQKPFIEKADQMLQLNKDLLDEVNGFKDWLKNTFQIKKLSKKLDKYYELTFKEFLDELKKKKVDTTNRKTQGVLQKEFINSTNVVHPLLNGIQETDECIDRMVYQLYGLSDEEIGIIEKM